MVTKSITIAQNNDASLTPRQTSAIPHIAAAPSLRQGARDAGIGYTTIVRWMRDPLFRAELDRARDAIASVAYAKLQGLTLAAVGNLEEFLNSPNDALRLRASRIALDVALRAEGYHDIRKRIDLLNAAFQTLKRMS